MLEGNPGNEQAKSKPTDKSKNKSKTKGGMIEPGQ